MELATLGWLLAGLGVALVWVTGFTILQYLVTLTIASKTSNTEQIMQQMIRTNASSLLTSLVSSSAAAISALIIASLRLIQTIYRNRLSFVISVVAFIFLLVIYFLQVPATETLVVGYQTVVSPTLHKFIYPLLNIASMLGSIVVAGVNWVAQIMNFIFVGIPKIIIGCLLNQDIYSLFIAAMNVIFSTTSDLVNWIIANPFIARYNTVATTTSIGLFLAQTTGAGNCTCAAVFFVYEDATQLVNSPEFIVTFDSGFNALLSILQRFTPLPLLFGQAAFTLDPFATEAPLAINGLGNLVMLALKLLANSIYGFFDTQNQLPQDAQDFLSQPLFEPGTQLVSGFVILTNITLEATKNPYNIYLGPTTGLPYFQFGKVIDRIRLAVRALGSYFILLGPNVVDAITKVLLIPVGFLAFLAEFIPPLIYYVFYPPVQNLLEFLLIYYQNPSNELLKTIVDAYLAAEEVGLVIKLANVPTGDVVVGVLSTFIALFQIVTDILFYSYNLFGFVNATPTYTDISTNNFFASLILTNEAVGDFFRQFDPDFCYDTNSTLYTNDTAVCAFSNAGTYFIDVVIVVLINIVRFLQTFLSALREPTPDFSTVDIPEFDIAITNAERSGCSLATAVLLLIPLDAGCQFTKPEAADVCVTGQTCAAGVLCEIWKTLLSLLRIANDFFIKLREGGQFDTFTEFFSAAIKQFIEDAADAFNTLGLLLDCLICRVGSGGTNCSSAIYDVFKALSSAIKAITELVTDIFFDVLKLIFTLFKNIFVDGNLIKALVDFTVDFFALLLKIGQSILTFLIDWLDSVGLRAISAVFKIFDFAFCNIIRYLAQVANFLARTSAVEVPECLDLSLKRRGPQGATSADSDPPEVETIAHMFPNIDDLPAEGSWTPESGCQETMNRLSKVSDFEQPEIHDLINNAMYCTAILYWDDYVETERHSKISVENVCDYVMVDLHEKQTNWANLSSVDRGTIMQCIQQRYFIDFIRNRFNVTYIPRDLRSNPLRLPFYLASIALDLTKVYHYYTDQNTLPGQVRQEANVDALASRGLNATYITSNGDLTDKEFGRYLESLSFQDYMAMNNVTHQEEIIQIDKFGRLIFNGGIDVIIKMIESGKSELEVSMGTALLGGPQTTSQSIVALSSRIIYNSYKATTTGINMIAGTSEKRAVLASGGAKIVEGLAHMVSGISNVTAYTITSYGEYRDRLARINAGTASHGDRKTHAANEIWWEQIKNKTLPWRWTVYNKPSHVRAYERRKMREAACRGNATCDIHSLALSIHTKRTSGRRMHPRQKSIGEHVSSVAKSIEQLRTPTPEAQARYDAITSILSDSMDYFYMGYRGGIVTAETTKNLHFRAPQPEGVSLESVHASSTAGYAAQSLFIGPPVCLTNYTNVCEKCIILDNAIATVLQSSGNLIAYINGRFQNDMQARRDFLAYSYDDNAPVRVGQRPGLPVWFPLPTVNSYHYIGPPENVTTIGFSDYNNITGLLPSTDGIIRDNINPGSFYYTAFNFLDSFARPLISWIENTATWVSTGTGDGTAEEISLVGKLVDDVWACDYGAELDGSEQRFPPLVAFAISLLVFFLARSLIDLAFEASGWISNTLPSGMIAIYTFLYLGWNWSIMCFPALPLSLSAQLFETIAYTLLPKCLYYVTGVLQEGHYHDELYCASADLASEVRGYSCRQDGQFNDIFAHIAFTTVNYWPSGISYLRSLSYIGGYVDTYLAVDMTDRVLYSFTYTCNYGFGIINLGLVLFGFLISTFLSNFLLALLRVAAIPILLVGDIYNTAFLAISETDYLMSIVADRERLQDRELVGESTLSTDQGSTVFPFGDDDGFIVLNSPALFGDTVTVPLDEEEEEEEDDDVNERKPILRTRTKEKSRTQRLFGLNRPSTAKNITPYDRL